MTHFRDRSTSDIIVMLLTVVVCVILVIAMVGLIVLEIYRPNTDIGLLSQRVGTLISSLIGAIIGYLAGRRAGD